MENLKRYGKVQYLCHFLLWRQKKNAMNNLVFLFWKTVKFYLELQYLHEKISNSFDQRSSNKFYNGLRAEPHNFGKNLLSNRSKSYHRESGVRLNSSATFTLSLLFFLSICAAEESTTLSLLFALEEKSHFKDGWSIWYMYLVPNPCVL